MRLNCFTHLQQCKMCNAIPNMTDMPSSRRVNVLGLLFCTRGPEFHLIGHFEYTSKSNTEFQESFMSLCKIFYLSFCISQFHLRPAPPPLGLLLRGIFPPCQSRRWGTCKFSLPGRRAFANPGAIPELSTRMRFPIRI